MIRGAGLAAAIVVAAWGTAWADDDSNYINLRNLELIDDACHVLQYFERTTLGGDVYDALSATSHDALYKQERIDKTEYAAWRKQADEAAAKKAKEVSCGPAAESLLLQTRAKALHELYADMIVAYQLDGVPADNPRHRALSDEEKQVADNFDAFVRQVYGANYDAFVKEAQAQAGTKINDAVASNDQVTLRFVSDSTFENVSFEVAAENADDKVYAVPRESGYGAAIYDDDGLLARVLQGPDRLLVKGSDERIRAVLAMTPGHELQLITYGAAANALPVDATVTLWIRTKPVPGGVKPWELFDESDWHDYATAFPGTPITPYLDGPAFAFPPEAFAALKSNEIGESAELFIAEQPDVTPTAKNDGDPFERNELANYAFKEYLARE